MALPFGVSWLCMLLFWCYICFPPQKGYNIAHGYSLNGDELSSDAGVLHPQTSKLFASGASLNTDQDSVSPRDEMQAMRHQSFVSLQGEPVHHENNEDFHSVTSLSEDMVQSNPDSEHDVPSAPPVPKYKHQGAGAQHPFGLIVKEHTQEKTMEGTSFQTINDFKQFIEKLKTSFLMPGSDLGHFQTAQDAMENEIAANAQNIKWEPDMGYRSNPAKEEETSHDDASENEVWSDAMNTAFEQTEQGANYQMPGENPSVPDPVDSTESLIYSSVYDNQDSGPGSVLYPRHPLVTTENVLSNYGSFDSGGISGKNPDIFTSAPYVQNEDVQSTSYKLPEQIPSGSYFGEDLSFGGYVTASPVNPASSPSQDFSDYSSKTNIMPLTYNDIQQPKYTSHSLTGYQKTSPGFELGKDFQSEELGRVSPANDLSAPMPQSLNSYAKSVYVNAPRGQHHIPEYSPKQRQRPAKSVQAYQPTVNKESKDINYTPIAHLPVSFGSAYSSSDSPSPQSSSGHVGVQTSSPRDAQNQAINTKQKFRFHRMFTVKPFSSLQDSSRHNGYLQNQTVGVSHPSTLTAKATDEEKSDLSEQNLASATWGSKQMADNTLIPISGGLDSTQSRISSWVGDGDANFNSLTNLAPTSAAERAFSRLVGNEEMSKNVELKPQGSFPTPLKRGLSLNGGYMTTTAGPLQTFIKPNKVWKSLANVNKEPGIMAYRHLKPVSASTLSDVFWRNGGNTKKFPPQTGPNTSPPFVKAYIRKSRSGYVRSKLSLSKTRYSPYQVDEYKNNVFQNVKGFEEQ